MKKITTDLIDNVDLKEIEKNIGYISDKIIGYLIRDGKIAECVKGATLIGTTLDILKNVEMVSDNLEYGVGNCGASSGWIPVTIGQPTVKISSILVGGVSDDN